MKADPSFLLELGALLLILGVIGWAFVAVRPKDEFTELGGNYDANTDFNPYTH